MRKSVFRHNCRSLPIDIAGHRGRLDVVAVEEGGQVDRHAVVKVPVGVVTGELNTGTKFHLEPMLQNNFCRRV